MFSGNIFNFSKKEALEKQRVFLVDDHTILIDGLKALLAEEDDYEVVGEAHDGEQALEFLKKNDIDILVTDYSLPKVDGLALVRILKRIKPDVKIIVLSMHRESHLVREILKEGVSGYILKNDSTNELLLALQHVRKDKVYLSTEINSMLIDSLKFQEETKLFSDREREILKLIAEEFSSRQIAEELFISERTVETHRRNMMKKAGTNTTIGLMKFGYENNLI
ncbi:MAG: response regulator transcription factor [Cyclobacteriaceae bacterium]